MTMNEPGYRVTSAQLTTPDTSVRPVSGSPMPIADQGSVSSEFAPEFPPIFAADTILDGTYRIVKPLGQGGMGEVYLAAHERLPGYFAVKAMQPQFARHPESVSRFRREAEILAGVRHPNVVQVVDFNVSPQGAPYLVMELIEGQDLDAELRQGRELGPADVISIVRQIASALDAAHAVGVVHRDLKPANVILVPAPGQAPVVKVIDFGISISEWSSPITTESRVMGTPEYMSPEQALGRRNEIDARSDQFALSALAHTLLAKRAPFVGDTPLATLSAIVHGEPEALAPYVSWPAGEVELVLRKGMARSRDDRYVSVLEFTDALEGALARSGALAEPARACPSAVATASGSSPALALTMPARRTPVSGSGSGRVAAAVEVSAESARVAAASGPVTVDDAPAPRMDTDELIARSHRRSRRMSLSVSLLTLLTLGGGVAAARSLRPDEFQRGVATATDLMHQGWAEATLLFNRVSPILQRLNL
jgi:serine/threonine protein kinase